MSARSLGLAAALLGTFLGAHAEVRAQDRLDGRFQRSAVNLRSYPAPVHVEARTVAEVAPSVVKARFADRDQVGSVHDLDEPVFAGLKRNSSGEGYVWSGIIEVPGASRTRLQLRGLDPARGATMWVSREDLSQWVGFDAEAVMDGMLWTPSVSGDRIRLTVESSSAEQFWISAVARMVSDVFPSPCFYDATCFLESDMNGINDARRSIAHMLIVRADGVFSCSGGLINDQQNKDDLFLTARHCVSTAAEAASIEFVWDAVTTSCGGSASAGVRTYGASLVASTPGADATLLRVSTLPAGRWMLGWDSRTSSVANGTPLFRLSHPAEGTQWLTQIFAETVVDTTLGTCTGAPRSSFIYSRPVTGGAGPGSSGAPVMLDGGFIVGQLLGACGPDSSDACAASTNIIDGALSAAWPTFQPYLQNGSPVQPETCQADSKTLCLSGSRFSVTVAWKTPDGQTGTGNAISMTTDTGHFWFFNRENVELVVKVLDARVVNGKFWVFYGALSNVEYTLTLRDVQTGQVKSYFNPNGTFASRGDTAAF